MNRNLTNNVFDDVPSIRQIVGGIILGIIAYPLYVMKRIHNYFDKDKTNKKPKGGKQIEHFYL